MGLIGKLKAKGRQIVLSKILALLVSKLAEGDFGSAPKAAYWWLAGKKTYLGLAFGAAWALLDYGQSSGLCSAQTWDCSGWSTLLGSIAAALLAAGLYDGAIRTAAPKAPQPKANDARGFGSRLALAALAIGSLLLLSACGSMAQLRLGEQRPLAPDPEVVEQLACSGKLSEAERYIELRGGSQADRIELVERAIKAVSKRPGCCAAEGKCGGGQPGSSLIVTP